MLRFGILLFEGCEELDVFGPFEALKLAADLGAKFDVRMGTAEPMAELKMAFGTKILPEALAPQIGDWLIVPGGGWLKRSGSGAWAEVQRGILPRRLTEWKGQGVNLASVCTGSMLLAAAGLLAGRPVTGNRGAKSDLEGAGFEFIEAKVVDDGDIVTAGGISSGLDLGLWLTERFAGTEVAQRLRQGLEYTSEPHIHWGPRASQGKGKPA